MRILKREWMGEVDMCVGGWVWMRLIYFSFIQLSTHQFSHIHTLTPVHLQVFKENIEIGLEDTLRIKITIIESKLKKNKHQFNLS
jgi:hypothetical protein